MSKKETQINNGVRVTIRVRPNVQTEIKEHCLKLVNEKTIAIRDPKSIIEEEKQFAFDSIYTPNATQEDIFQNEVVPLIPLLLQGFNTTIFCYGITCSGKTYTIQGSEKDPGVIPRTLKFLLENKVLIKFSMFEIYNEKTLDLLNTKSTNDLQIREDSNKRIIIESLTEVDIKSFDQFMSLYVNACKNRKVGSNGININSSRSHAIIKTNQTTSKLHLCDLAGSEDNRKTQNIGKSMTESSSINKSLFNLRKVVKELNDKESRISYRDSKLTRILQDSLGGNAYSLLIANISATSQYYYDTLKTLEFASKSKKIVNVPIVKEIEKKEVIQTKPILIEKKNVQKKIPIFEELDEMDIVSEPIVTETKPSNELCLSPKTKLTIAKNYLKRGSRLVEQKRLSEGLEYLLKAKQVLPEDEIYDLSISEKLNEKIMKIQSSPEFIFEKENIGQRVKSKSIPLTNPLELIDLTNENQMSEEPFDLSKIERNVLVYLNHSSFLELKKLKGVGDKISDKIINNRPFEKISDLKKIGFSSDRIIKFSKENQNIFK